jgi:hypothetical protein
MWLTRERPTNRLAQPLDFAIVHAALTLQKHDREPGVFAVPMFRNRHAQQHRYAAQSANKTWP